MSSAPPNGGSGGPAASAWEAYLSHLSAIPDGTLLAFCYIQSHCAGAIHRRLVVRAEGLRCALVAAAAAGAARDAGGAARPDLRQSFFIAWLTRELEARRAPRFLGVKRTSVSHGAAGGRRFFVFEWEDAAGAPSAAAARALLAARFAGGEGGGGEGCGSDCREVTPPPAPPPLHTTWPSRQRVHLHNKGYTLTALRVPVDCLRALLPPGGAPPLTVGLQLFLDGSRHGGRFPAEVNAHGCISRDVTRMTELEGCRVAGWRLAAPRALDALLESDGSDGDDGGGGVGGGGSSSDGEGSYGEEG